MAASKKHADLKNLPQKWENVRELRGQVADGRSLMLSTVAHTNSCMGNLRDCSANYYALLEVLNCMVLSCTIRTPKVDVLGVACTEFLQLARYPDASTLVAIAHRDAWGIKRCLSTLKRKWMRNEVPKDYDG